MKFIFFAKRITLLFSINSQNTHCIVNQNSFIKLQWYVNNPRRYPKRPNKHNPDTVSLMRILPVLWYWTVFKTINVILKATTKRFSMKLCQQNSKSKLYCLIGPYNITHLCLSSWHTHQSCIQKPQHVVYKITHKLLCDSELPTFVCVRCSSTNKWCYPDQLNQYICVTTCSFWNSSDNAPPKISGSHQFFKISNKVLCTVTLLLLSESWHSKWQIQFTELYTKICVFWYIYSI